MQTTTASNKTVLPSLFPKQTEDEIVREIMSAEKSGDMTWEEFIIEQSKWEQEHLK
jgi:hypothetical protein